MYLIGFAVLVIATAFMPIFWCNLIGFTSFLLWSAFTVYLVGRSI